MLLARQSATNVYAYWPTLPTVARNSICTRFERCRCLPGINSPPKECCLPGNSIPNFVAERDCMPVREPCTQFQWVIAPRRPLQKAPSERLLTGLFAHFAAAKPSGKQTPHRLRVSPWFADASPGPHQKAWKILFPPFLPLANPFHLRWVGLVPGPGYL